jgi:dipeptidyl aminopeptidase/acylaminoacyl peptidase
MKRFLVLATVVLLAITATFAQQAAAPFTINDLLKVRRLGDPQLSPDGKWIAYQIGDVNKDANRAIAQIYLIAVTGGEPKQLTTGDRSSSTPRWSPDGARMAFVNGGQLWTMDTAGGAKKQVTTISTGAGDPVWSPDGKWIAFVSDVYPDCKDDACNKQRDDKMEASKVKAKIVDRLLFRHWTAWKDGKRTHVFVVSSDGGTARDMTAGDYDAPPFSLGGPTDYAFSPDSKELSYVSNTEKVEATSTNSDIFVEPVAGGDATRVTGENKGYDLSPQYSPDGRYLAYRSQATAGFEADRFRLMVYDRQSKQFRELTTGFDLQVDEFVFSPDSKTVYFTAGDRGRSPIFAVPTSGGAITKLVKDGSNGDTKVSPDGKTLVFTRSSMTMASEIFRANADGSGVAQLTKTNEAFLAPFKLRPAEDIEWDGAAGAKIQGWLIKPANFTPDKKWPLLVLIHGGPQSVFGDSWGNRWNPQVFANAGYVVLMPNPRGSIGFGQQFINEITGDWGGKAYTDIMNGVAYAAGMPFIDHDRIGAAGASYGGYMINWIEGHNTDPRFNFKVLVSHDGVYNLTSMYGATEELWFTDWEFKGRPWDNPEMYAKWSPHNFVKNFKTPMLVIHSELDYRVPVGEGLQLFTALQLQGVPSKLLYFPDEGHWVLKPQNSELWYNTVIGWVNQYLKP